MKPPNWRLQGASYPNVMRLETGYRDVDQLGHVNNIAIAGYYDEARSRFTNLTFAAAPKGAISRIVTVQSRIAYMGEVFHPNVLEVRTGILRIGRSSYDLAQALFQKDVCVGVCDTTLVQATSAGAEPLDPRFRAVLEGFLMTEAVA